MGTPTVVLLLDFTAFRNGARFVLPDFCNRFAPSCEHAHCNTLAEAALVVWHHNSFASCAVGSAMTIRGWSLWLLSLISSLLLVASLGVLSTHAAGEGELHISALLLSLFLGWPLVWGLMMFFVDWPDNPRAPALYMTILSIICVLVLVFLKPALLVL